MTPEERRRPVLINGSRRKRIARGSGVSVEAVNRLLRQFAQMRKMLKTVRGMAGRKRKSKARRGPRGPRDVRPAADARLEGAHSAPRRERRGAVGSPQADAGGSGRSPVQLKERSPIWRTPER